MLFEVDEVRLGEVGSTVVIHTPGGPAGNGNCSIGPVTGLLLVAVRRDEAGWLRGGMCTILPIDHSPDERDLNAMFGPPFAPQADVEPEILTAGAARPPDPEDIGARAVFEELGGELDFSTTSTSESIDPAEERSAGVTGPGEVRDDSKSVGPLGLVVLLLIAVAGSTVLVKRAHGASQAWRQGP
ncbi:MAG: hypothetical protein GY939_11935 [Actinomycetia bacterium]|nr:hypothetical protein [Actinomycetes bacterium]